ncbi:MAG: hypothetical protein H7Y22_11130 [Gemmatimonadaceae bacterium]|nr:hypothetical protein [Gloeobacterales cyanobacterium ES-bin-141]
MGYEEILKSRIADYYEQSSRVEVSLSIREAIHRFLSEHSMRICDEDRLFALEYRVRAEIQNRVLASHLKWTPQASPSSHPVLSNPYL